MPAPATPGRSPLDRYFAFIDSEVGEAMRQLNDGDLLLVVSAFGMEPMPIIKRGLDRLQHRVLSVKEDGAALVVRTRVAAAGTDESVLADWEMLELLLPALRADYRAIDGYTGPGGPPLRCPVTVFVGDSDPHVTVDQAVAWRAHTVDGEVDLHRFAGGHFYLAERPDEFADRLLRVVRTGADRP